MDGNFSIWWEAVNREFFFITRINVDYVISAMGFLPEDFQYLHDAKADPLDVAQDIWMEWRLFQGVH